MEFRDGAVGYEISVETDECIACILSIHDDHRSATGSVVEFEEGGRNLDTV